MSAAVKETTLARRRIGRTLVEVVVGDVVDQPGIEAGVNPTTGSMRFGCCVGGASRQGRRQALAETFH